MGYPENLYSETVSVCDLMKITLNKIRISKIKFVFLTSLIRHVVILTCVDFTCDVKNGFSQAGAPAQA